jgi:hypothetical protein
MALRRWGPKETALQAAHVNEGRDFFNEEPKPEYYKPYVYPHPLQRGGRDAPGPRRPASFSMTWNRTPRSGSQA